MDKSARETHPVPDMRRSHPSQEGILESAYISCFSNPLLGGVAPTHVGDGVGSLALNQLNDSDLTAYPCSCVLAK
jgi:hypothetical protein